MNFPRLLCFLRDWWIIPFNSLGLIFLGGWHSDICWNPYPLRSMRLVYLPTFNWFFMTMENNNFLLKGDTLPETNSSPLKINGWKMKVLLGWPIFRGELLVSGSVHLQVVVFCWQYPGKLPSKENLWNLTIGWHHSEHDRIWKREKRMQSQV